jgi:hypothetical protein
MVQEDAPGQFELGLPHPVNTTNTGRMYTSMGQRIAWTVLSEAPSGDGKVYKVAFYDIDRGIPGEVLLTVTPSVQSLMHAYDHNQYVGWIERADVRDALREAALKIEGVKS